MHQSPIFCLTINKGLGFFNLPLLTVLSFFLFFSKLRWKRELVRYSCHKISGLSLTNGWLAGSVVNEEHRFPRFTFCLAIDHLWAVSPQEIISFLSISVSPQQNRDNITNAYC